MMPDWKDKRSCQILHIIYVMVIARAGLIMDGMKSTLNQELFGIPEKGFQNQSIHNNYPK